MHTYFCDLVDNCHRTFDVINRSLCKVPILSTFSFITIILHILWTSRPRPTPVLLHIGFALKFDLFIRLRNDLYCVEWGVKLYLLTHLVFSITISLVQCGI